jgi:hypothetical protein
MREPSTYKVAEQEEGDHGEEIVQGEEGTEATPACRQGQAEEAGCIQQ